MDAVKFIEEAKRMCNANISNCAECCKGGACPIRLPGTNYTPKERVNLVEEWSAAHPRKTRQSVFLKHYPEASISHTWRAAGMPLPNFCIAQERKWRLRNHWSQMRRLS